MKKYSDFIIIQFTFIFFILLILNKTLISNTIISSFYVWFYTLVPSMLPMFIISDILINYEFTNYIPKFVVNGISKLFNISKNGTLVFLISLISGFPANALTIKGAYNKMMLTKNECEHLLYFCNFSNPLFILNTVGVLYLKNNIYGYIILFSHVISNVLIGIILRNKNTINCNYTKHNIKSQSFGNILSESIKKSINALLIISGTICLFLILSTLICNIFNLNKYFEVFIKGILEMTTALYSLSIINISNMLKVVIATAIISFSGLSIHMQVMSCLGDDINYKNYLVGRIYQVIISSIIAYLLFNVFLFVSS